MSELVISVEGLGKKYRLGANAQPYKTLRESLVGLATRPLDAAARLGGRQRAAGERGHRPEFWALKDVTFQVRRGEVLGIVGRNGAGKSTLLKLLSRITAPAEGRIRIRGRVASLLEVGTGFHPELTGRENIYLNGAILGMSRVEITQKFADIVAFAEIEQFIDTPVKHYSSGMYVRLAFAVAAHLEPEILVVDEVLAVGDTAFQMKCLGKMSAVSREGRTVLFVSHNLGVVRSLCARSILLQRGRVIRDGDTSSVLSTYVQEGVGSDTSTTVYIEEKDRVRGSGEVLIESISLANQDGLPNAAFAIWEPMHLQITIVAETVRERAVGCWVLITNSFGETVLSTFQYDTQGIVKMCAKRMRVGVSIDNILRPGEYALSVGVLGQYNELYDSCYNSLRFTVDRAFFEHTRRFDERHGQVTVRSTWKIEEDA